MRKPSLRLLILAAVLGGGFVWGFFSHREGIFPYGLLRSVFGRLDPQHVVIDQRSAPFDGLQSLPYLDRGPTGDAGQRGVLHYEPDLVQPGVNFYHYFEDEENPRAMLVDMEGRLLHEWSYPHGEWHNAELLPNGDLVITLKDQQLARIDADSKLLWKLDVAAHHDSCVLPDGTVYALIRRTVDRPEIHPSVPVYDDRIAVVDPSGRLVREVSLLDALARSRWSFLLPVVNDRQMKNRRLPHGPVLFDVLHTNHIEVFDGRQADQWEHYAKGNVLVSFRDISTIAILEPRGEGYEIVWVWGPGNLAYQHHPTLLPSGNLLVFNNGISESEVIEYDPRTSRVAWRYSNGSSFFSRLRGSAYRLPNGNTLISETDKGFAHEVRPDGHIVWQFANPDLTEDGRSVIWRMHRIDPADLEFEFARASDQH